ncbi:MAG: hypothetical protein ACRDRQ_25075 [Pseudonocardiaceae bacterium]
MPGSTVSSVTGTGRTQWFVVSESWSPQVSRRTASGGRVEHPERAATHLDDAAEVGGW